MMAYLRSQTKAWWSSSVRAWFVRDNRYHRTLFGLEQTIVCNKVINKIHPVNFPSFQRFQEVVQLKGYSSYTLHTYTIEFAQLLYILKSHPVESLTPECLRSYFLYCKQQLKLSESEIHSRINAVKFYTEQVLYREKMFFDIPRPKKPISLPKKLNRKEIQKLFDVIENKKNLLMMKLCFGMGLRVSVLVALKISDIDSVLSKPKAKKTGWLFCHNRCSTNCVHIIWNITQRLFVRRAK